MTVKNPNLAYLVAPWIDIATSVSASTAYLIKRALEQMGYVVKEFYGILDWNFIFTNLLPLHDPGVVIYTGHGLKDKWLGDDPFLGTLTTDQAYLLKDRAVIAVPSCYTASGLGIEAVKEGARFYVGSNDLVWVAWNEWDHEYRRDFEFTWFTLVVSILNGISPKESLITYKELCTSIAKYYEDNNLPNGDYYAGLLIHNRDHMVVLGNENDILVPPIAYDPKDIQQINNNPSVSRY
ncbi:MAG: hypothetical protein HeimC3_55150 [Candidatus Heimdallarchaeota archaeon LC_3]|nr:MAG: hypothetical protein HeimC3_55150 [Candidatus Heimdallarchaeota archaeon LC_3]